LVGRLLFGIYVPCFFTRGNLPRLRPKYFIYFFTILYTLLYNVLSCCLHVAGTNRIENRKPLYRHFLGAYSVRTCCCHVLQLVPATYRRYVQRGNVTLSPAHFYMPAVLSHAVFTSGYATGYHSMIPLTGLRCSGYANRITLYIIPW